MLVVADRQTDSVILQTDRPMVAWPCRIIVEAAGSRAAVCCLFVSARVSARVSIMRAVHLGQLAVVVALGVGSGYYIFDPILREMAANQAKAAAAEAQRTANQAAAAPAATHPTPPPSSSPSSS